VNNVSLSSPQSLLLTSTTICVFMVVYWERSVYRNVLQVYNTKPSFPISGVHRGFLQAFQKCISNCCPRVVQSRNEFCLFAIFILGKLMKTITAILITVLRALSRCVSYFIQVCC
jgi:hypothetical protein